MGRFIGRREEMAALETAYRSKRFEMIPVYGRRRVGKSELILRFLEGKPGLYFLGQKAPAPLLIREFLAAAARALKQPLLAEVAADSWRTAFRLLLEQKPAGKKFVIDLGECKWGRVRSPGALEEELTRKVKAYPNPGNATIQGRLFTRHPLHRTERDSTGRLHSLEDLFAT